MTEMYIATGFTVLCSSIFRLRAIWIVIPFLFGCVVNTYMKGMHVGIGFRLYYVLVTLK